MPTWNPGWVFTDACRSSKPGVNTLNDLERVSGKTEVGMREEEKGDGDRWGWCLTDPACACVGRGDSGVVGVVC